jgi:aspartyl/asparaginyl-tRNA synthetase
MMGRPSTYNVVDFENTWWNIKRITTGAAISVTGTLVESKGAGQKFEIQVVNWKSLIQMQRSSQYKQRTNQV